MMTANVTTWYVKGSGLHYEVWHPKCGHAARGVFPFATKQTPSSRVLRWLYGHEQPFCRICPSVPSVLTDSHQS